MNPHTYLDRALKVIGAHLKKSSVSHGAAGQSDARPFITISREVCAGANTLGQLLLPLLDKTLGEESQQWAYLDKTLLSRALTQSNLSVDLSKYLPEDETSDIEGMIGELVGLHPSIWQLERQMVEAILQFAKIGRVILVGRGTHLITKSLPGGFHLRLVAPKEVRIGRMMSLKNCDENSARAIVEKTDAARRRYVYAHFDQDIDDPHFYDLVINTGRLSLPVAAQMVVEGLRHKLADLLLPDTSDKYVGKAVE